MKDGGSTWNDPLDGNPFPILEVEGEGRRALLPTADSLDCGNSGTTMRLLMGIVAASPFRTGLIGDDSLNRRPMERVAEPLRLMGASIDTVDGHPPVVVEGGRLTGVDHRSTTPSAQVKGAILLAGVEADGITIVRESIATRDHTERALQALGGHIDWQVGRISVKRFQHEGFSARVPGDPSGAAFLVAAAALTGSPLELHGVGLNPSRLRYLEVLERMGVHTETRIQGEELGEPVGELFVAPCDGLSPVRVPSEELPLVVDEVPALAAVAAHAPGDSWFLGAGELRVKESDRLAAIVRGIRNLGGHAGDDGTDLVVAGGGLEGGHADPQSDHRIAMALTVAGLMARGPCEIDGIEAADVSFPGFVHLLATLGARIEVLR
jgi:3-phosphoshikimate 1-carboxyvinyltransferase